MDFVDETKNVTWGVEGRDADLVEAVDEAAEGHTELDPDTVPEAAFSLSLGHQRPPIEEMLPSPLSAHAIPSPTPLTIQSQQHRSSWTVIAGQIPQSEVSWPLPDAQEALLLHHFVTSVSRFVRLFLPVF